MDMKEYQKQWREKNKQKVQEYSRKSYLKNKEKISAKAKLRNQDPNYKKEKKEYDKKYWQENKERLIPLKIKNSRIRRQTDASFRITDNLRRRINAAMKGIGIKRSKRSIELLGVSDMEFFWNYLESKFKPGMPRENYGKEWHIDHIIPCVAFDLSKEENQKMCFHYTNLQPLWAHENLSKSSKIL